MNSNPTPPDNSPATTNGAVSTSAQGVEAALTRRSFIGATGATALSCLLAQACGSTTGPDSGAVTPPPLGSTTFTNGVVTLQLSLLPALTGTDGHQVFALTDGGRRANLVVLNVGSSYRAFTSICTHDRCVVTGYSNKRMICPCHNSQFNQNGQRVAGPAPSALREYTVTLDATAQTLTIPV